MQCFSLSLTITLLAIGMISGAVSASAQDTCSLKAMAGKQWFKGNTHCHTLWSDGDAPPERMVAWYKEQGYHFLCLSDHNVMNDGSIRKYQPIEEGGKLTPERLEALKKIYGADWVEEVVINGSPYLKLKALPALAEHFEETGKFLLMPGEEITCFLPSVHINGLNLREVIVPHNTSSEIISMKHAVDMVAAQSEKYGVPMLAHLNHPNFSSGATAEDLIAVKEERFFEVYNGHPSVYNAGSENKHMPSTDRIWDIALSLRLKENPEDILYGLATDDTHDYYVVQPSEANAGRGYIYVLSAALENDALIEAIQRGEFYASTGVVLSEVTVTEEAYTVAIEEEDGVTYTTQFYGTPKGFDASSKPLLDKEGSPLRHTTAEYSDDIGQVLFETSSNPATYTFAGDELYVRAKIISSKSKENVKSDDEVECAWAQPVRR